MPLQLATPSGLDPQMDAAFDEVIAPLQSYINRELTAAWVALTRDDIAARGDSGVTIAIATNLTIGNTPGFFRYAKQGAKVTVSFDLGVTPSGVTGQLDFLIPLRIARRSYAVGYDSAGVSLSLTLGTPAEILGLTATGYNQMGVLHLEKLTGADFAGSAFTVRGQIQGEVVHGVER